MGMRWGGGGLGRGRHVERIGEWLSRGWKLARLGGVERACEALHAGRAPRSSRLGTPDTRGNPSHSPQSSRADSPATPSQPPAHDLRPPNPDLGRAGKPGEGAVGAQESILPLLKWQLPQQRAPWAGRFCSGPTLDRLWADIGPSDQLKKGLSPCRGGPLRLSTSPRNGLSARFPQSPQGCLRTPEVRLSHPPSPMVSVRWPAPVGTTRTLIRICQHE